MTVFAKLGVSVLIPFTLWKTPVWKGLIYQTGGVLPFMEDLYNREIYEIIGFSVDGTFYAQVSDLQSVKTSAQTFYIDSNIIYVHFKHPSEAATVASAQFWLFSAVAERGYGVTNGDTVKIIEDAVVITYKEALKNKITVSETADFDAMKLEKTNLQLNNKDNLYLQIGNILGNEVLLLDDRFQFLSRLYVKNCSYNRTQIDLECENVLASLKEKILLKNYNREDYLTSTDNVGIDDDTAKRFMQDAVGFCRAVPADCINGKAADTTDKRKYRVSWGKYTETLVELEIENGWKTLQSGEDYSKENGVMETWVDGSKRETGYIVIPALKAHPPQAGSTDPDYETAPRRIRVTGHFNNAYAANIQAILQYFFTFYSNMPFNETYFNISEISSELAYNNRFACGVCVQEPIEFIRLIENLQTQCVRYFQLLTMRNKITVREMYLLRPTAAQLSVDDVLNFSDLKISLNYQNYASSINCGYGRFYSEGDQDNAYEHYLDVTKEKEILNVHKKPKNEKQYTILKDLSAAQTRTAELLTRYKKNILTIQGMQLFGRKWFVLHILDILIIKVKNYSLEFQAYAPTRQAELAEHDIDVAPKLEDGVVLTENLKWIITRIEKDTQTERVSIDIESV
jgi:hypothetical protein